MSRLDDINPRLLALVALVICGVAFIAVIIGSSTGDDSSGSAPEVRQQESARPGGREQTDTTERPPSKPAYTVRSGDTLASIAEQVNVPVEKLQQLNPDLDPQALVSGQKIKLRE